MAIDLSVLVCSTHTRYRTFGPAIQRQVFEQYEALPASYQDRIEILILTDTKSMMLGHKRNCMVDIAQGRYVQFVDDDDRIAPDMFSAVLDATTSDADVITFLASVTLNGGPPKICRFSKDHADDYETPEEYGRLPNHICCIRKELAAKVSFPHVARGEDAGFSKLLHPHLHSQHHIDRVLYFYDYSDETTETQLHRPAAVRRRQQPAIVDVVVLSYAKTPELAAMTQETVRSCVATADSLPVNVTVLEQEAGYTYDYAQTVHVPAAFNYNAFANRGADLGSAEWIMVANNDLVFHDGWLHHLLAAQHPVVSPKCPHDERQRDITVNTTGYTIGRHLSGWCFMLRRDLWRAIGGFDECVSFWYSDNVVVEQVRAAGVTPMLVVDSVVEHLRSMTLNQMANYDELTRQQQAVFEARYGAVTPRVDG
jgi:hypothetical protein